MKKASMLVFRLITAADFFNIYKERGAEKRGGGQSYIDVDTSGVSLPDWHAFFSGINHQTMEKGPLWAFEVNSLELRTSQILKIGQRRPTSVSIRAQKLKSSRSNRLDAWHPAKTPFPKPASSLSGSSDLQIPSLIKGLVVFIIRATDDSYWAGWMQVQNKPAGWVVPTALESMFEDGDGFIQLEPTLDFNEFELNWPFYIRGISDDDGTKFHELTEKQIASDFFDGDYSSTPSRIKYMITKTRERNQKAVRLLKELYGKCQISGSKYVFEKIDGKPYLEVHHLIPLGLEGADAPANLVVLSAHMHRMLHYADVSEIDLSKISGNKLNIQINGEDHVIRWRADHAAMIKNLE